MNVGLVCMLVVVSQSSVRVNCVKVELPFSTIHIYFGYVRPKYSWQLYVIEFQRLQKNVFLAILNDRKLGLIVQINLPIYRKTWFNDGLKDTLGKGIFVKKFCAVKS